VTGDARFSLLIGDFFNLYNVAVPRLRTHRAWVAATCRRSLAVLRAYRPANEGQEILIETAIEQFEELLRRAGGNP
jgi:hypothetical protein